MFFYSQSVIETLAEVIPQRQEMAKKLRSQFGDKSLGEVKVENVFGGMRGLKIMLWDPSVLDANEGIRFWGRTIPECQEVLPKAPGGKQMLPESMLFYLRGAIVIHCAAIPLSTLSQSLARSPRNNRLTTSLRTWLKEQKSLLPLKRPLTLSVSQACLVARAVSALIGFLQPRRPTQ